MALGQLPVGSGLLIGGCLSGQDGSLDCLGLVCGDTLSSGVTYLCQSRFFVIVRRSQCRGASLLADTVPAPHGNLFAGQPEHLRVRHRLLGCPALEVLLIAAL